MHIIIFTRALGRASPSGCTREMKRKEGEAVGEYITLSFTKK